MHVSLGSDYVDLSSDRVVDQIVVEHGTVPLDKVYFDLKPRSSNLGEVDYDALIDGEPQQIERNSQASFKLFRIGDAVASRNIHAANYDALPLVKDLQGLATDTPVAEILAAHSMTTMTRRVLTRCGAIPMLYFRQIGFVLAVYNFSFHGSRLSWHPFLKRKNTCRDPLILIAAPVIEAQCITAYDWCICMNKHFRRLISLPHQMDRGV